MRLTIDYHSAKVVSMLRNLEASPQTKHFAGILLAC